MPTAKDKSKDKNGGTVFVTYASGRVEELYSKTTFGIKHDQLMSDLKTAKETGAVKEFKVVKNNHA